MPRRGQLALPQSTGPKLSPFLDHSPAEFVRVLRADEPECSEELSSEGPHSHVFEVSMNSRRYALKIFHFYYIAADRFRLISKENEKKNLNGVVAARCYGYLEIPAEREKELHTRFNIACWDRMPEDEDFPMGQRRPLRAVVKELVLKDPPLTGKLLSKMKGDLIKVRQVGIFPMDIVQRNYKGGLLVDFDIVMTEPHYIFDIKKGRQLERFQRRDMGMFQEMIDQSGVKTTVRAVRNREYCSRLRSEKKRLKRLERY